MTAQADPALVQRILEETRVDRTVPSPGWTGYVEAVAESLFDWLHDRVPGVDAFASMVKGLGPTVAVLGAAGVLLLLFGVVRATLRRSRRGTPVRPPAGHAAAPAVVEPMRDRSDWRAEMESRLSRGDVKGALEALWWWLARSLSSGHVDPSWTSQELLARSGRRDLAPLTRALDRLIYAAERPTADDVRRFLGRLEPLLP
jgi:hypothetical protein